MRIISLLSSLFILYAMMSACSEMAAVENTTNDEVLIIGLTYGECGGDCSHLWKLEKDKVFADTETGWWNGSEMPKFSSEPISNAEALSTLSELQSDFPRFLLDTQDESFGCPDCGDWGALHVITIVDGESRKWTLDNMIESNPEEIQAWALKMQTLIYDLM